MKITLKVLYQFGLLVSVKRSSGQDSDSTLVPNKGHIKDIKMAPTDSSFVTGHKELE